MALPKYWKEAIAESVTGQLLAHIESAKIPNRMLFFGCGRGVECSIAGRYFPRTEVVGYDIDSEIIAENHLKLFTARSGYFPDNIYFTSLPEGMFDAVIARSVMHHDPKEVSQEMLSLAVSGGFIGVIDYDMVGFAKNQFLASFRLLQEKQELTEMGIDACHRAHTSWGLEQCVTLMESQGVRTLFARGGIRNSSGSTHFQYLGMHDAA
jgi:trans-aconitate methyltransferase